MFDDATIAHLHRGSAFIVGTVAADGRPHASRGWGCRVLSVDPPRLRVIVAESDHVCLDNLATTRTVSITTAHVLTLYSLQLKGTVDAVGEATPEDLLVKEAYCASFFDDVEEVDGNPRAVIEEWPPNRFAAFDATIADMFDQTPGPSAGALFAPRR